MANTYSSNLRLIIQTTGENAGVWGAYTNTNIATLLEQAITGIGAIAVSGATNYTLTTSNGASDESRNAILNVTGTLTAAINIVCPTVPKTYIIKNGTTGGFAVTLKTSAGTGISVPNGSTMFLYCDGTNVVEAVNYQTTGNFSSLTANSSVSGTFATSLLSYPTQVGSKWESQYHANWNVIQTKVPNNPTEWQIYSNAANGIAQVISGTNQVVRVSGSAFDSSWVGLPYFYWEGSGYKVLSVTDSDHLTVQTTSGGAVTWGTTANGTYYFCTTSVEAIVNTNGVNVTYVSGQPFIPVCNYLYINGVQYNIATFVDNNHLTLTTSAGTQTNVSLKQYVSIADELTNIRLQGLAGTNEENFVITFAPKGTTLQSAYAGSGKYRPIWLGTGENPIGTFNPQIGLHPNGTLGSAGWLTLGGDNGSQAVVINQNSNNVNYFLQQGSTTGANLSLASRGADTNINMNFDTQGTGRYDFTSGSFTRTNFRIYGSNATSFLAVDGSTSATPYIAAIGSDTNISINLIPKGTGSVITSNSLGVGGIPYAGVNIYGNKAITGSTSSANFLSTGAIQSDVTDRGEPFISYTGTQAAAFTLGNLRHFSAYQAPIGAGSAVQTQVGFYVNSGVKDASNNIGFQSSIASVAGCYNFYASGTAQNHFNGDVLIYGIGGLGYTTGSGGAVTQATSRTTGVTLNKTNGAITLVSAAGSASYQSFTVTNSTIAATDTIIVNQKSGTDLYEVFITAVAAGSFRITFATTGGTTTEQPVFNFSVIKAVTA